MVNSLVGHFFKRFVFISKPCVNKIACSPLLHGTFHQRNLLAFIIKQHSCQAVDLQAALWFDVGPAAHGHMCCCVSAHQHYCIEAMTPLCTRCFEQWLFGIHLNKFPPVMVLSKACHPVTSSTIWTFSPNCPCKLITGLQKKKEMIFPQLKVPFPYGVCSRGTSGTAADNH